MVPPGKIRYFYSNPRKGFFMDKLNRKTIKKARKFKFLKIDYGP